MDTNNAILPQNTIGSGDFPPFDVEAALIRFMRNADVFGLVLDSFINDLPGSMDKLEAAIQAGDCESAAVYAHTLKGSVGFVTGDALSELARQTERLCLDSDLEAAKLQVDVLRRDFDRCVVYAKRVRHDLPSLQRPSHIDRIA